MTDKPSDKRAKQRSSSSEFADEPLPGKIGSSLKRMYDDVVNEPVPDDFLNLLAKADKAGRKSGSNHEGA